jgi:hypothetical protein
MDPNVSVVCSQDAVTGPYIESDKSSPLSYSTVVKVILVLRSYLCLHLQSDLFF